MRLSELARLLGVDAPRDGDGPAVALVTEDSRCARPGAVFFACPGVRSDGHDFAAQAVERGAVAVAGERDLAEFAGAPYWRVPHARQALAVAAHALAGDPSRSMTVVGVTGTNGKSSVVTAIRHVLEHAGRRTASFGTLGYVVGDETLPAKHTTPFAEELAHVFANAVAAGVTHVAMEASSHALDQERVAGIHFDVGVFTNLTQDHLDYHADMTAYRNAKRKLFERVEGDRAFTVVNCEDPHAQAFIDASRVPCHTYGEGGAVRARDVTLETGGTRFGVDTPWGSAGVQTRLIGLHNVSNLLATIAVCGGLDVPLATIADALGSLPCVPGRFECVDAGQDFQVVVDYAHTEDGLRNVLAAARAICDGRILCVFGCGGDRDRTKRPRMARAAAELADYAFLTSDNPRTEDPARILDEVEVGMTEAGKRRGHDYAVIADRREAIRAAIAEARTGDLVMVAGKGHEDYQIIGEERIHFDDREEARGAVCAARGR